VQGKEYGPADLETLREWEREGRLLAQNPARLEDVDLWKTAAEIPGLFTTEKLIAATVDQEAQSPPAARRSFFQIVATTLRIYRQGFFQFLALTLFTVLPSVAGQITSGLVNSSSGAPIDLRTLLAGAFSFCMLILTLVLWPIYIAGIQVLSAEFFAGRRIGFVATLNQAIKYWPRVAGGCIFVYCVFILLGFFALLILSIEIATFLTVKYELALLLMVFVILALLVAQVWMFGRFFTNVLFWQQFVVLENRGVGDALRESKSLARSGCDLPWYRRPLWRGALIVSLVVVFWLALYWPIFVQSYNEVSHLLATHHDVQSMLDALKAQDESNIRAGFSQHVTLWGIQKLFQPLLGIAFVVLYFDSRVD
jgi:hypothetical protein